MAHSYDLGPMPRPVVVQFIYADGTASGIYALPGPLVVVPDGVAAVEIRQLPVYPHDYPEGDEPGWGNEPVPSIAAARPGRGSETRVEVRGPERFRRPQGDPVNTPVSSKPDHGAGRPTG